MPVLERMPGFTKMMYAIVMKVVSPATTSVRTVVPFSLRRNQRSKRPPASPAAAALLLIDDPSASANVYMSTPAYFAVNSYIPTCQQHFCPDVDPARGQDVVPSTAR